MLSNNYNNSNNKTKGYMNRNVNHMISTNTSFEEFCASLPTNDEKSTTVANQDFGNAYNSPRVKFGFLRIVHIDGVRQCFLMAKVTPIRGVANLFTDAHMTDLIASFPLGAIGDTVASVSDEKLALHDSNDAVLLLCSDHRTACDWANFLSYSMFAMQPVIRDNHTFKINKTNMNNIHNFTNSNYSNSINNTNTNTSNYSSLPRITTIDNNNNYNNYYSNSNNNGNNFPRIEELPNTNNENADNNINKPKSKKKKKKSDKNSEPLDFRTPTNYVDYSNNDSNYESIVETYKDVKSNKDTIDEFNRMFDPYISSTNNIDSIELMKVRSKISSQIKALQKQILDAVAMQDAFIKAKSRKILYAEKKRKEEMESKLMLEFMTIRDQLFKTGNLTMHERKLEAWKNEQLSRIKAECDKRDERVLVDIQAIRIMEEERIQRLKLLLSEKVKQEESIETELQQLIVKERKEKDILENRLREHIVDHNNLYGGPGGEELMRKVLEQKGYTPFDVESYYTVPKPPEGQPKGRRPVKKDVLSIVEAMAHIRIHQASKKIQKAWKDMKERKFRDEYRKLYEMSKPPSKSLHELILTKDNPSSNQYDNDYNTSPETPREKKKSKKSKKSSKK